MVRKRIEKLARGSFEYDRPDVVFSMEKVELEVLEGQSQEGEFTFESGNNLMMRGVVYTSNPRMECLTPQFEGKTVRIRYKFHSEGLMEGDVQKGDFYIIANQGEYNLSFVAQITKLYADSSVGKVRNLIDFTCLAQENWNEACKVFTSSSFRNIIKPEEKKERMLYEGLSLPPFYMQNVEEFLVSTGKKSSVLFSVNQTYREYYGIKESQRDVANIRKDQWGYLYIEITSDADFVIPEKQIVTTEDFIGSSCDVFYIIDVTRLHAGKNYARLTFYNAHHSEQIEFCISTKEKSEKNQEYHQMEESRVELTKIYIDYRLKHMVTGEWAIRSGKLLDHMNALQPENEWFQLMKAQTLLMNRQRQEASWIMDEFKRGHSDKGSVIWGYYLYLCTLAEREPSYVNRLTTEIETIYYENGNPMILFWVLLFLKEDLVEDAERKYHILIKLIRTKTSSPFFYLEAFYILWQNPYMLTTLDETEVKILRWAAKRGAINKDLAIQIMNLVEKKRNFEMQVYQLLCVCYQVYQEKDMLGVICAYLIKGHMFTPEYLHWYEKGIEADLRITNLNEAYMMSLDNRSIVHVPKVIQMYFQYDNQIPYKKKAVLFVNIIANKERQPEIYQNYRKIMERFCMEQIELGHIDDNLSFIYEEMLEEGLLTRDMAAMLSKIIYTHKISCFAGNVVRAVIIQPQLKKRLVVPLVNGSAYFPLFGNDYAIFLEDEKGHRFTGLSYQIEKLMRPGRYLRRCLEYASDKVEYALGYVSGKENFYSFEDKDGELLEVILKSDIVSEKYKARLCPRILEFFYARGMEEQADTYLKQVDFAELDGKARGYVLDLLLEKQLYDRAYVVLRQYGNEQADTAELISLCSYEVEQLSYEEDDFLIGLCMDVVRKNKYNDTILTYLCQHYNGSTKQMVHLWQIVKKFELDTFDLEERILVQMLYSTEFVEDADEMYISYERAGGTRVVCLAYLNFFAQSFFVDDVVVEDTIFPKIQRMMDDEEEVSDACKLALLKYYGMHKNMQNQYTQTIDQLLREYTQREMYFAFYKNFSRELQVKYYLEDKVFIEYHTREKRRVVLNYCIEENGEFVSEEMEHMYAGIYVKQFVLFFGDAVQYYVTENIGEEEKVTESNRLTNNDMYGEKDESRYARLNGMLVNLTLREDQELERRMSQYEKQMQDNKDFFHIL